MSKALYLVFCSLSLIVSFGSFGQQADSKSFEDVTYKKSSSGKDLQLDVFLPTSEKKKFPVIMFIHGGAWVMGNKSLGGGYYSKKLKEAYLRNGFAVVSINYSLVNDSVHFPAPMQDCKDALKWLLTHADTYKFDTSKIGLWGASAGAHLALLTGNTGDVYWRTAATPESHVKYIIDNFGPVDLTALLKPDAGKLSVLVAKGLIKKLLPLRDSLIYQLTGYNLVPDKSKVIEVTEVHSPLQYANNITKPTLILHGTKDRVVPFKHSKWLRKKLQEADVAYQFIKVKKGNHGFTNISNERLDELIDASVKFSKKQLGE